MREREEREEHEGAQVLHFPSNCGGMNRRCLSTEEEEPSETAGRGSDLCQCVDDPLQRYNVLENRRAETKK